MTSTTAPPVSRATLEDRWDGLMADPREPGSGSKLLGRLDRFVQEAIAGVARVQWTGELDTHDGEALDGTGAIADEAEIAIRAAILNGIERRGIAR